MRTIRSVSLGAMLGAMTALGISSIAVGQATPQSSAPASPADSARADTMGARQARPALRAQVVRSARSAQRAQQGQRAQRLQRVQRARQLQTVRRAPTGDRALLSGITLSEAQRERLETVRQRYRTRAVELRRSANGSRQRVDSAQRAAALQRMRATREQATSLRRQELSELRAILTPEQQKSFDANQQQRAERAAAIGARRAPGARPARPARPAPPAGERVRPDADGRAPGTPPERPAPPR